MIKATGIKIYDERKKWQTAHENLRIQTEQLLLNAEANGLSPNTIFGIFEAQSEALGYEFDFMEGKDPKIEADYEAQLLKLGQGEVLSADTNGDGEISLTEYIYQEIGEEDLNDEEFATTAIANYVLLFNIMDGAMGNSDGSDSLSAKEYASFYKNVDSYDGEADGRFLLDDPAGFASYAIDAIFDEETIKQTKEVYGKAYFNALSQ